MDQTTKNLGHEYDALRVAEMAAISECLQERLPTDLFELVVDGDRSLLEPILVGAAAFAAD